jgi:hypothetical protein
VVVAGQRATPRAAGAYERRAYLCRKKDFQRCGTRSARRFKKSTYIRPASVNSMGGYYTARTQRVDGLSQLKKQKPKAAGSSGAVQASRMENDAPVVGPDAPTADSKMVKRDTATANWSRLTSILRVTLSE